MHESVLRGPPHIAIRMLVAPVLVASTAVVFGTGVAVLALDRTQGMLVGLHKASFVVWAGAFGLHLLTRAPMLLRALRRPATVRVLAATLSVVAGVCLAVLTLPAADHLQDSVTFDAGFDGH